MTPDETETIARLIHAYRHPAGYSHTCDSCRAEAVVAEQTPNSKLDAAEQWTRDSVKDLLADLVEAQAELAAYQRLVRDLADDVARPCVCRTCMAIRFDRARRAIAAEAAQPSPAEDRP